MKILKKLLIINILFICVSLTAQNANKTALALNSTKSVGVFEFETDTIDYGTINQNTDGKRTFTFKNTGNAPIIISKVKGSCGCTVATKPNQPIMPNETAEISVKYATNRVGSFSKSITITSNANTVSKIIKIKGKVIKAGVANLEKSKSLVSAN